MSNVDVSRFMQFLVDIIRMYHYHSCGFISDIELFKLEDGTTAEELHKKLYEIRCNAMGDYSRYYKSKQKDISNEEE